MSKRQKNEHPGGLLDAAAESLENGNFREASALLLAYAREQLRVISASWVSFYVASCFASLLPKGSIDTRPSIERFMKIMMSSSRPNQIMRFRKIQITLFDILHSLPVHAQTHLITHAAGISVLIPRYSCARTGAALSSRHG
jgi:hypothetical protein